MKKKESLKIFLLGASGFIGSKVLQALPKQYPEAKLYILQHTSKIETSPNVIVLKGNLFTASKYIKALQPDIVFHVARVSMQQFVFGKFLAPIIGYYANKSIYNAICTVGSKLVFISGSLMYGNSNKKITESATLQPISFAKYYYKAERPFVVNKTNARIMVLRPAWVFGANSWFQTFYTKYITAHQKIPLYATSHSVMNIIHVEDLARLICAFSFYAKYGKNYNMVAPITITKNDFVNYIAKKYNLPVQPINEEVIKKQYSKVVLEAFTSSCNLSTRYPEYYKNFKFAYPSLQSLFAP